jgi:hypothetical protein
MNKNRKKVPLDLTEFAREVEPDEGERKRLLVQLTRESDWLEMEQIRLRLALPMSKRTHFLRQRVGRGSSL